MIRSFCVLATAVALTAGPAGAAVVAFTGSEHNTTRLPQPSPACAPPAALVSFGAADDAVGTSNFGSFGTTQTHCIVLPPPAGYDNGHFSYAFARGDTLTGTYFGTLGFSATPGLLDNVQHFTVTGGIERSLGASGTFTGIGTLDLHPGANLLSQHDLAGTLTLPAAPEPAAWLLMIAGFGLVGAVARQQRAVAPRVTLAAARAR